LTKRSAFKVQKIKNDSPFPKSTAVYRPLSSTSWFSGHTAADFVRAGVGASRQPGNKVHRIERARTASGPLGKDLNAIAGAPAENPKPGLTPAKLLTSEAPDLDPLRAAVVSALGD
jgi:hypothetical protein